MSDLLECTCTLALIWCTISLQYNNAMVLLAPVAKHDIHELTTVRAVYMYRTVCCGVNRLVV